MTYRITAFIRSINEERTNARIRVTHDTDLLMTSDLIRSLYEAIIKSMRDTNKEAFYDAMTSFIDEELNNED
jgi:hypothetical protein